MVALRDNRAEQKTFFARSNPSKCSKSVAMTPSGALNTCKMQHFSKLSCFGEGSLPHCLCSIRANYDFQAFLNKLRCFAFFSVDFDAERVSEIYNEAVGALVCLTSFLPGAERKRLEAEAKAKQAMAEAAALALKQEREELKERSFS